MSEYMFGAGSLWATPTQDAFGNAIAANVASPVNFGVLQDVSLDVQFDTKLLYGGNQFPVAVGRGKGKIEGKAKFAKINGMLFNSTVFGQGISGSTSNAGPGTGGGIQDVIDSVGILIPATPFQITITSAAGSATNIQVPNTGALAKLLSVRDAANNPMFMVTGTPATGEYAFSGTTLTFAAADTGLRVFIDYQFTYTGTGNNADLPKSMTIVNVPMGYAPAFAIDFQDTYSGKQLTITLPQCISTKLTFATKLDDFGIPEFDFQAFANAAGQVIVVSTTE